MFVTIWWSELRSFFVQWMKKFQTTQLKIKKIKESKKNQTKTIKIRTKKPKRSNDNSNINIKWNFMRKYLIRNFINSIESSEHINARTTTRTTVQCMLSFGYVCTNTRNTYNKWRPSHCHVDTMIVRPPLQILLMIGIVDCVIKFLIDLW